MRKAFTLIELLVAMALLAMVLAFASVIFRVSIESHRVAAANAEIMQKLRAITDQLDADFQGLRKDGEIFVIWNASLDPDLGTYVRSDRIMFFADGDFQSLQSNPHVTGNLARITYSLARRSDGSRATEFRDLSPTPAGRASRDGQRRNRILTRTQHILTADPNLPVLFDVSALLGSGLGDQDLFAWHNYHEYDTLTMEQWKNLGTPDRTAKADILSVVGDVDVAEARVGDDWRCRGTTVDPADPNTIQNLLCRGVGQFKIQGWYAPQQRWLPEVDPNNNGVLTDDSDFILDGSALHAAFVPGVLYPNPPFGRIEIGSSSTANADPNLLNEENFNLIPGLGKALKFTFTLCDSKGVIPEGRTFTHIVYLDN